MQVWRMNADGSEQTRVTWEEESNCWFPTCPRTGSRWPTSPIKRATWPRRPPAPQNVEIRLMDADGGNGRVLCSLFGGQGTLNVNSWSPAAKSWPSSATG